MVKLSYRIVGLALAVLPGTILLGAAAMAQETSHGNAPADLASAYKTIGLGVAAAFAIAVSVLGAGYAVGRIGSAALGLAGGETRTPHPQYPLCGAGGRAGRARLCHRHDADAKDIGGDR